jgi:predicted TIM-barrel fold metal-dependent hydrolase
MMQPIIDAHHHIWRQRDLPWLVGPMQPRIFGGYEAIRRDYLIEEFLADLRGTGVEKSIYVQANWAEQRFEDEVAWVQSTAQASGWPHAIIAYAPLLDRDIRPQLDRLAKYPLVRGVRMQVHWHQQQRYRFARQPDLVRDEVFRRNVGFLAEYGWCFELQVFAEQMADAADLAAENAGVRFVLQHAGMLEDRSAAGCARWQAGMAKLAACPNVVSKLSGLGTFIHRNDAGFIAEVVAATMAWFGPARCLFGSNFPIEKLWTDYASLVAAYRAALADFSPAAQAEVFWRTAERVYRLAPEHKQGASAEP